MKRQLTSLGNGLLLNTNAKRRLSSLGGGLLLLATFGAIACDESEPESQETQETAENEFGVNFDALGVNLPTCTAADTTATPPVFVASTKTLNLTLTSHAGADAVVSVVGGKLKVNGYQCKTAAIAANPGATPPVAAAAAIELTSTNVNKINITADNTNKVVLDLLPGTFGNIFGASGGVVITGNTVAVGVRGSTAANVVKMGQESSTAYYFELSGDTKPDLKIDGTAGAITLALGDGADSFTAQGQALATTSLGGTNPTSDVANATVLVYGGAGADTLKGGTGNDTLDGGDGADIFQTSAGSTDDGADIYIGGAGVDLIDYSGRTDAVAASVAPASYTNAWVEGANLFNLVAASGATLLYTSGTGAGTNVSTTAASFAFTAAKTGATAIMADLVADSTLNAAMSVSLNDKGELVLVKKGALGILQVTGGTANLVTGDGTRVSDALINLTFDADDGFAAELDDVRSDVENITGGTGNDTLTGGPAHDTINGGAGNDIISGGPAGATCADDVDVLNGGDGDDIFALGMSTNCGDALDGGAGIDLADYQMRTAGVNILIDTTANDGEASEADKVLATVEIMLGGSGADTMTGGTGNDEFHGGPNADLLSGAAGNDSLVGGPGADTLLGGAGEDYFNETDSVDQYRDSRGTLVDAFLKQHTGSTVGSVEADLINGGADFDTCDYNRAATAGMSVTLCTAAAIVNASGNCANATTDTPDQDDITNCDDFVAGAGNDTIIGSDGDDMINGGTGNDTISGGLGNDQLIAGGGTDTLNGGGGEDICGNATTVLACEI